MRRAASENSGLTSELARGDYQSLLKWLREKIHLQGSRHTPNELIRLATGRPTGIGDHVDYLRAKFV